MRHSGGPGRGRGGNYEGEGRGGGRAEGQRDSNNSVPMETEGRRGGVMVPKSSDNSTGFASILSCHGRALCATGMTAGISPGLLCYYCLMQNTHHQPRRFHLLDPATSFLLENSRFPQVPVNKRHRHPGQSQEIWGPGLILITRLRLEYRPSKVSVKTQVSFLP